MLLAAWVLPAATSRSGATGPASTGEESERASERQRGDNFGGRNPAAGRVGVRALKAKANADSTTD